MRLFTCFRRKIFWARCLALLSLVFFIFTFIVYFFQDPVSDWDKGTKQGGDLFQHYAAGVFWSEGRIEALYRGFELGEWINQYQAEFLDDSETTPLENINYLYPPLVAWISSLGISAAFGHWVIASLIANLAAYILSFYFLVRMLNLGQQGHAELPWLFFFGFSSFYYAYIPGQNTVLSLLIVSSSAWLLTRHRPILAGLVVSCICYKPQFIPFIGLATLLCGQWRFAISTGVGFLIWNLAGVLICGSGSYLLWLESLSNMQSGIQFQRDGLNQSWRGLFLSLSRVEYAWMRLASLTLPVVGCGLIAMSWWKRRGLMQERHPALPLLASMMLFLFASPYIAHYDLLMGLPLWLYALDRHPLPPSHIVILSLFWLTALLCVGSMFIGLALAAIPITLCWLAMLFSPDWAKPCSPAAQ